MPHQIRLVALDLDGTLLNPRNRVSDADALAVREAVQAGVTVVLATSRWHQAARRTALSLGLDGYIISHNGALVRSCNGAREILHHRIEEGLAREIAAFVDSVAGDAYLTIEDRTYIRDRRSRDLARLPADMAVCSSLAETLTGAPTAFLLFGRDAVRATVERFNAFHGKEINLAEGFSDTFPDYLNVVHAEADKGSALRALCTELSIPLSATLAAGDAAPDIAMLKAAGVGIAMGNAAEAVKDAAAAVAPSNSEDGVAWAIREFVLA